MRSKIGAAVLAALVSPAAVTAAQPPAGEPVCRATIDGTHLTTVVQFDDGYTVEEPWQVLENRPAPLSDGQQGIRVRARLDRIVEVDPETGQRQATPFDHPVDVTFEGHDGNDLMERAARIWCASVSRPRAQEPPGQRSPQTPTPTGPTVGGTHSA